MNSQRGGTEIMPPCLWPSFLLLTRLFESVGKNKPPAFDCPEKKERLYWKLFFFHHVPVINRIYFSAGHNIGTNPDFLEINGVAAHLELFHLRLSVRTFLIGIFV